AVGDATGGRPAARDRAGGVPPALPARRLPGDRATGGLRDAPALAAPRAGGGAPRGVPAPRRGDRPDRAARLVGPAGGLPPARAVGATPRAGPVADHQRAALRPATGAAGPDRARRGDPARDRGGAAPGAARAERARPDGARRRRARPARAAARAGGAGADRRLRHGQLVAGLSATLRRRRPDDRSLLHQRG